ncbi:MAG: tetratricopeptide repeat protein [Candidatus Dormibacteraeota bacterium]|nr:tetratricopeptide repeat protein [Candidatus Dormibacteraeota bacterium]
MKIAGIATLLVLGVALAGCGAQATNSRANGSGVPAALSSRPGQALNLKTDDVIARDQRLVRANPANWQATDELAAAYLQRVREVGDPSYYPKAEALLQAALRHDPADLEATTQMGTLSLARHQFADALAWGRKAHALGPFASRPLGIISDAQTQLGHYDEAIASLQQMVNLRPDLSSYSRISYLRELYGDVPGAIDAMKQAIQAGGPVPENLAYTEVLLGNLYFNGGHLTDAEGQYQRALRDFPGYVQGLAGLASVRAAQKKYGDALALYQRAIDIYPVPQYVIALGDVYAASGSPKKAAATYDLAAAEQRLFTANGVDLDQELALFDADHQRDLPEALAAARRAMRDRPNVITADSLAWTLYQTGDYPSAMAASTQAHRLGTLDALAYFHTGMIEKQLGQAALAQADLQKAIAINPYFSVLYQADAVRALASLKGHA